VFFHKDFLIGTGNYDHISKHVHRTQFTQLNNNYVGKRKLVPNDPNGSNEDSSGGGGWQESDEGDNFSVDNDDHSAGQNESPRALRCKLPKFKMNRTYAEVKAENQPRVDSLFVDPLHSSCVEKMIHPGNPL
jgi:hypothetical protein